MSWDASLVIDHDGHEIEVASWNYTHNCNSMIRQALEATFARDLVAGRSWWDGLSGLRSHRGCWLLANAIAEMQRHPDQYRAMNPENGWGDYDSVLTVLEQMRATASEWPSARWVVHG